MTPSRKALFLIGSPKPTQSTSESLGNYLLDCLSKKGFSGEKIQLQQAVLDPGKLAGLLASASDADLVILAFPTYIDSLPAPVVRALEELADFRHTQKEPRRPWLLAIANCGFPEPVHNEVSLAICQQFAKETGYEWAGGLSLGGGGALGGSPLLERKGMARNIIKALEISATALVANQPIPDTATALMARPMVPRWLYLWVGNYGWKRQSKRYGTQKRLRDRPLSN